MRLHRSNSQVLSLAGPIRFAAIGPAVFAFFVGTIMFAIPLLRGSERLRRPIALIVIGVL
jgi:hypothetical protein